MGGVATWKDKILDYEIETCWHAHTLLCNRVRTWKDKILDYEIETCREKRLHGCDLPTPWKDKILDYEIETPITYPFSVRSSSLEKTRFSITRLKPGLPSSGTGVSTLTWKDKILDYEIETEYPHPNSHHRQKPWKDKILDYEIETWRTIL